MRTRTEILKEKADIIANIKRRAKDTHFGDWRFSEWYEEQRVKLDRIEEELKSLES